MTVRILYRYRMQMIGFTHHLTLTPAGFVVKHTYFAANHLILQRTLLFAEQGLQLLQASMGYIVRYGNFLSRRGARGAEYLKE